MNVCDILKQHAVDFPCRPAIIDRSEQKTRVASFSGLESEVGAAATYLQGAGLGTADVVLIYVPLRRELISLLLAVFRLGAQALFIDPGYSPRKILHCLRLARPTFMIVDRRLAALRAVAPLFGIKKVLTIDEKFFETDKDLSPPENVQADHPALITFTSGSTGKPKGIVRSHGFLINQARLLQKTLPGRGDRCISVLTTLPMFILSTLASGDTAIIPATDENDLMHQLYYPGTERIICAPHSLEQMCALLERDRVAGRHCPVREVIVGGGPVFPELLAKMRRAMPDAAMTTVYGSTEAEPICHQTYDQDDVMPGGRGLALGKKIDEINLQVIDPTSLKNGRVFTADQFASHCRAADVEGEFVVSGAHVIGGYLTGHGDEETKFVVDGEIFHRTGDAGYIDKDGEVFLTGRINAAVVTGSETIYPLTVELAAKRHPAVANCAFVRVKTQKVLAVTLDHRLQKKFSADDLLRSLQKDGFKIDRIIILNYLPVDQRHQSKILYSKLRRQLRFRMPG